MSAAVQHRVNVAAVRLMTGLDMVANVGKDKMLPYWKKMGDEARAMILAWRADPRAIMYSLAASLAEEMREAHAEQRWPDLAAVTTTDERVAGYGMVLTDARPLVDEAVLNASGDAWWEEFRPQPANDPLAHAPSPGPAEGEQVLRRGRSRTRGSPAPKKAQKPARNPSRGRKGRGGSSRTRSLSPEEDDGMETDTSRRGPARRTTRGRSRSARRSRVVDDDGDEAMASDSSRRSVPTPRKRSRSQSTVAADVSDEEDRPALKSAMKKTKKRARIVRSSPLTGRPLARPGVSSRRPTKPQAASRGKGKARATSADLDAESDDDADLPRGSLSSEPSGGLGAHVTNVAALIAEYISEEDWHDDAVLSERRFHAKVQCDLASRFGKGGKTSEDMINDMLFLLKVAEERAEQNLVLPATVGEAALMLEDRHPRQHSPAPPEEDYELTDGEETLEWWRRTRATAEGKRGLRPQKTAARAKKGKQAARGKKASNTSKPAARHRNVPPPPVVYMKTRGPNKKTVLPSDLEVSSGELEDAVRRPSVRRPPRMRLREANDSDWQIFNSPDELQDTQGDDWDVGGEPGPSGQHVDQGLSPPPPQADQESETETHLAGAQQTGTTPAGTATSTTAGQASPRPTPHTEVRPGPTPRRLDVTGQEGTTSVLEEPPRVPSPPAPARATPLGTAEQDEAGQSSQVAHVIRPAPADVELRQAGIQTTPGHFESEAAVQTAERVMVDTAVQTDMPQVTGTSMQTLPARVVLPSVQWSWGL
ncbi:hypothetical protein BDW22DRAFT_1342015 [Trametopsis cervina]|nr:hypothetical protein BDW22DRAFT_1342015 [Trametopsis cervina]